MSHDRISVVSRPHLAPGSLLIQLSWTLFTLQDVADPGAEGSSTFPTLLALHALCCVDVSLCQDPRDPQKFVRCLAPYLKVWQPDERWSSHDLHP